MVEIFKETVSVLRGLDSVELHPGLFVAMY